MKNIIWLLMYVMCFAVEPDGGGPDVELDEVAPIEGDGGDGGDEGGDTGEPKTMLDAVTAGLSEMNGDIKEKPEEKPPLQEGEKPPVDLTMPDGLTPKAQERFQTLANTVKEHGTELETLRATATQLTERVRVNDEFFGSLSEAGIGAPQMTMFMDYVGAVRSGDLESAYKLLTTELNEVSRLMGKPLPGADPLHGHDDLRDAVDNMQMTEERAIELARLRDLNQQTTRRDQNQQQQQTQAQQVKERTESGLSKIDEFVGQKVKSDIDYKAKEAIIMRKGDDGLSPLDKIIKQFPPELWDKQLSMLYDAITVQKVRTKAPTPLRPNGGDGGSKAPATMLEAINSGLGYQGS